jgi:hypothetical protein
LPISVTGPANAYPITSTGNAYTLTSTGTITGNLAAQSLASTIVGIGVGANVVITNTIQFTAITLISDGSNWYQF